MCINLLTVRWLLHALGSTDYGINNVVGGIVAMMSFFTATMSSAAQRFYAYEIGSHQHEGLARVFNSILLVFVGIAIVIILLCECFGPWMINHKLTIPEDRLFAAHIVFQSSLFSFLVNMMVVPMMALVIAKERMGFYSLVSITDAVLKALIVLVINYSNKDKLILYAILLSLIACLNLLFYFIFCKRTYSELHLSLKVDNGMLKKLGAYCGWYLFGSFSTVIRSQGVNILLNMFFLPVINAARAIAYQVNSAVNMFVTSFYQAVRPQIVKRYAAKEFDSMLSLLFNSTKLSYYLVVIIAAPLLVMTPQVLSLWLEEVPDYTILFTRLVIIMTIIETLGLPITTAICADGNIKRFQIVTGVLTLLNLPLSYLALRLGASPESTMIIAILLSIITQFARMLFAKRTLKMDLNKYLIMLIQLLGISLLIFSIPILIYHYLSITTVIQSILFIILMIIYSLCIIFMLGLSQTERKLIYNYLRPKING